MYYKSLWFLCGLFFFLASSMNYGKASDKENTSTPKNVKLLRMTVLGGVNQTSPYYVLDPEQSYETPASGNLSGAFGIIVEKPIVRVFKGSLGLETGFFTLFRQVVFQNNPVPGQTSTFSFTHYNIPIVARLHLQEILSFGAGVYWGIYGGRFHKKTVQIDGQVIEDQDLAYSDAGLRKMEFGLVLSAMALIDLTDWLAFAVDLRMLPSITDMDKSDIVTLEFRDVQVTTGITLAF